MGERPAETSAKVDEPRPGTGSGPREPATTDPEDRRRGNDKHLQAPRPEPENDVALARMLALALLTGLGMWIALVVAIL